MKCRVLGQMVGWGACRTGVLGGVPVPACEATVRHNPSTGYERLVRSLYIARPEDWLAVCESGCNLNCLHCSNSSFIKTARGGWVSAEVIGAFAKDYLSSVTVMEPRERATSYHSEALCDHCGGCVTKDEPSEFCPSVLTPEQVVALPQGFGPLRNIIAFQGGDLLGCCPEWYQEASGAVKQQTRRQVNVLVQTNGFAVTKEILNSLEGTVDAFQLEFKAFDPTTYKTLTGGSPKAPLTFLKIAKALDFTLEVVVPHIRQLVDYGQHQKIARAIAKVDPAIPTTLQPVRPGEKLPGFASPTFDEVKRSYETMTSEGLTHLRVQGQVRGDPKITKLTLGLWNQSPTSPTNQVQQGIKVSS